MAASLAIPAQAQGKDEVGLLLGGSVIPNSTPNLKIGSTLAYQATYAHRFFDNQAFGFAFEVPFVALPSQAVHSVIPTVPQNFASLFLTPGFRVTLAPKRTIAPWASVGGGYSRFAESSLLENGTPNIFKKGTNKGALQYGGGVDLKAPFHLPLPLLFRGEIRDFYSGQPRLNIVRSGPGQHNIFISGGFVLRFP